MRQLVTSHPSHDDSLNTHAGGGLPHVRKLHEQEKGETYWTERENGGYSRDGEGTQEAVTTAHSFCRRDRQAALKPWTRTDVVFIERDDCLVNCARAFFKIENAVERNLMWGQGRFRGSDEREEWKERVSAVGSGSVW